MLNHSHNTQLPKCLGNELIERIKTIMTTKSKLPFGERAKHHPNALARRLFEIAEAKQTNIVVSADLTTTEELLSIAEGGLHIARVVLVFSYQN